MSPEPWQAPEGHPVLESGAVHVWGAALDPEPGRLAALAATLTADESARAASCRLESQRRRFVAGRGQLRLLLGRYLGTDASEVRFVYGPHGKPALFQGGGATALSFNVAHSGERALFAVGRERELGIDLERIREGVDHEAIAERFFAPGEAASLRRLPARRRTEAFFACWVRKEAYVKALGTGLSAPRGGFEAPIDSVPGFSVHALTPGPGLAAALVVQGSASTRCFSLEWDRRAP